MIRYYLARIAYFLCGRVPPRISYKLASLVGEVLYLVWPRARASLRENITHVLGPRASQGEVRATARRALRNFSQSMVDFGRLSRLKGKEMEAKILIRGWENIDEALERGRGAILVGLHQASWDMAAAAITSQGYPLNVIVDSFRSAKLNQFVERLRAQGGTRIIPASHGRRAGSILQALRRNELLALLIDRPPPQNGVRVEFFREPILVSAGAATLALRTGAAVMTGSLVRLHDARLLGFIDQQISFEASGNFVEDVRALTQAIVRDLEGMVRHHPDQWYTFRQLWV
ncbi:MAG: lysophospholipid acyltransferase family protein [Dehalococcoidia bacterium]